MSYNFILTTPGSVSLSKSITSWDRGVPIYERTSLLWCTFMRMHSHFKYSSSSACSSPTDSMGDSAPMQNLGGVKVICACLGVFLHTKKKRNSGIYVYIQLGSEGAETKKWHSFFVEDYWRQIAWRSFVWWCFRKGEFKTVSVFCVWAHRIEVHIPIRARENFVVNRWNLLILSGHVLCEHDSSWMRQATEDEVRQELPYRLGSFNPSWRLELVCISLSEV